MADVFLSRKDILSIMDKGRVNERYMKYEDSAFLPIILAMDVIEREKKKEIKTPADLKVLFDKMPECVNTIPLSAGGLCEAMSDKDFAKKYINRKGNPFEFATEATAYEYNEWWDRVDILDSFMDLSWE